MKMNELIRIAEKDGTQLVNARDLHEALQAQRDFSNWVKDRIEKYGFIEGEDFFKQTDFCSPNLASKKNDGRGGHNKIDYLLTLDMAKELAMVENNEVGRNIRRYLIRVEKKAKELAFSGTGQIVAGVNARLEQIEGTLEGLAEFKSAVLKMIGVPKVVEYRTITSQLDEDIYNFYKKHIDDTVPSVFYTKAIDVWELFKYDTPNKYSKADFMGRFKSLYQQFAFGKHKNVDVFWGFRLIDTCGIC